MEQCNSDKPKGSTFSFCSIIEIVIFIVAIIILQIPMIYVAGSETYYTEQKHPLDSIFEQQAYLKIKRTLALPKQKYTHLYGEKDSGIVSFVKNFASQIKEKKPVIIREYSDDEFEAIYAAFRMAKSIVEEQINLQEDTPKIFILFCFSGHIPRSQIQQIQVNPEDRIITITSNQSKIKQFRNIKFPQVKISDLQKILHQKMNMDHQTISILINHYKTVPEMFENLNKNYFSVADHLGENYAAISLLDQTDKEILRQLCNTGEVKGTEDSLLSVGVIMENGRYFWRSEDNMLNYELQEKIECQEQGIATDKILQDYDNFNDDQDEKVAQLHSTLQENEQQKEGDKQNDEKKVQEQNKKSKKKSNKKKSQMKEEKKKKKSKSTKKQQSDDNKTKGKDDDESKTDNKSVTKQIQIQKKVKSSKSTKAKNKSKQKQQKSKKDKSTETNKSQNQQNNKKDKNKDKTEKNQSKQKANNKKQNAANNQKQKKIIQKQNKQKQQQANQSKKSKANKKKTSSESPVDKKQSIKDKIEQKVNEIQQQAQQIVEEVKSISKEAPKKQNKKSKQSKKSKKSKKNKNEESQQGNKN